METLADLGRRGRRDRRIVAVALVGVVAAGVLSRALALPGVLGKELGDALWTVMVYLIVTLIWPGAGVARVAITSLVISYADEASQMYHSLPVDRLRTTFIGHVVLGSAFAWADMVAYTVGAGVAAAIDAVMGQMARRRARATAGAGAVR